MKGVGLKEKEYLILRMRDAVTEMIPPHDRANERYKIEDEVRKQFKIDDIIASAQAAIKKQSHDMERVIGNGLVVGVIVIDEYGRTAVVNTSDGSRRAVKADHGTPYYNAVQDALSKADAASKAATAVLKEYQDKVMFLDQPSDMGRLLAEFKDEIKKIAVAK